MKLSAGFLAATSVTAASIDYNLAPPNLSTLDNATLYETWRPRAHVLPPKGKIGDPCMYYTNPVTGAFHIGFLHDGISGATTDDLATYRDLLPGGAPSTVPGGENDPVSMFDGSVIPSGIDGKPTLLYTSVSRLPIHWSIPYTRGSETQSLAVSHDGGHVFTKLARGPVIDSPPPVYDVTAFRDPYVFQNRQLDAASNSASGTWYTVISGGIHDAGPGMFLYRQEDSDFQNWEFLGQWWHEPTNTTWGNGDWAGGWGFNFEVGNIFSLDNNGYNPDGEMFVTLGAEGSTFPIEFKVSSIHDMLWVAANVSNNGNITLTPTMAGVLDWGISAYAAAGNILPASSKASSKSGAPDRFISYIWLTGDIYELAKSFPNPQQNWTGSLLFPRELNIQTISNVVDNDLARESGTSWRTSRNESGTVDLQTMGINMARETKSALLSRSSFTESGRTLKTSGLFPFQQSPKSKYFVLEANISFPSSARNSELKSGFQILSSENESTTIYYQFSNESVIIDLANTSAATQTTDGIFTSNEAGKLRLFNLAQGENQEMETLDLTIVVDNAVLEVYANGRFALSTWARSWYANSTNISFFHSGMGEATFSNVAVSEGLFNAWPDRT